MNPQGQIIQFRTSFHANYIEITKKLSAIKVDDRGELISQLLGSIPTSLEPNELQCLSRSVGILAACLSEYFIDKSLLRQLSRALNAVHMALRICERLPLEVIQRCNFVIQHSEFLITKSSGLPETATLQIKAVAMALLEKEKLEYEEKTLSVRSIEHLWDFDRNLSVLLIRKVLSNIDTNIRMPDWIAIALEYLALSKNRNEALLLAEKISEKNYAASQYATDDLENLIFKMKYIDSDSRPILRARYGRSIREPRTAIAMLEHHLYIQSGSDQSSLKPRLSIESIRKLLRSDCGYWQKTSSIYRFIYETENLLRYAPTPSLLTKRIAKLESIMMQTLKHSNKIMMQKIIEKIWNKYRFSSSQLKKNQLPKKKISSQGLATERLETTSKVEGHCENNAPRINRNNSRQSNIVQENQ